MNDWTLYRTFLAVVRTGSQSGAARSLGLAQPTVRRHVEALEAMLGRTLFLRSPSGLVPNTLALALRPAAEAIEAHAAAIERRVSASGGAGGTVRISASRITAAEVLPSILAILRDAEPELRFEIEASDEPSDLLRQEADIAIRMVRPTQLDLVQRHVGDVELGLFAHRSWAEQHTMPDDVGALVASGALLGFDRDAQRAEAWSAHLPGLSADAFALRCDDDTILLQALRAGLGIGVCHCPLAARDDRLVRVLPEWGTALGMWIVTHPDLRGEPHIAATFDHLSERLADYATPAGGQS